MNVILMKLLECTDKTSLDNGVFLSTNKFDTIIQKCGKQMLKNYRPFHIYLSVQKSFNIL